MKKLLLSSIIVLVFGTLLYAGQVRIDPYSSGSGGTGDLVGPASSVDNELPRYDTTTGKLLQGSGILLSDTFKLYRNSTTDAHTFCLTGYHGDSTAQVDALCIENETAASGKVKITVGANAQLETGTITVATDSVFGQTGTTADDDMYLAAYDVDGTAYTNLVTLKAGNTPYVSLIKAYTTFNELLTAGTTTLTALQASRTQWNSLGRSAALSQVFPLAAEGLTTAGVVGTQHNSAWRITRQGTDDICWISGGVVTCGKTYIQETNQVKGSRFSCTTFQTGSSPDVWSWECSAVAGTWVTD